MTTIPAQRLLRATFLTLALLALASPRARGAAAPVPGSAATPVGAPAAPAARAAPVPSPAPESNPTAEIARLESTIKTTEGELASLQKEQEALIAQAVERGDFEIAADAAAMLFRKQPNRGVALDEFKVPPAHRPSGPSNHSRLAGFPC